MSKAIVETRILRWVAPNYEDSYTQYQVLSDGSVWISQIALRNNSARVMQGLPHFRPGTGDVDAARLWVEGLIRNRADATEELTS